MTDSRKTIREQMEAILPFLNIKKGISAPPKTDNKKGKTSGKR